MTLKTSNTSRFRPANEIKERRRSIDRAGGGQWKSTQLFTSSFKGRFTSLMIRFFGAFIKGDDIRNKRNLYVLHGGLGHGWEGYSQERERVLAVSDRPVDFPQGYPKRKDDSSILTINLTKKGSRKLFYEV